MASRDRLGAVTPVVVIPAFNEAARVAKTVAAARLIEGVTRVIVVDDGSTDATAEVAAQAGAKVYRQAGNFGKAAAMERGVSQAAAWVGGHRDQELVVLFLDADLESSARAGGDVLQPVLAGQADMSVANLPPQSGAGGGHGFVVRLARDGIRQATGVVQAQPLSGQRAITYRAFTSALPLARGWGVEVGLTVDVLRHGFEIVEVPADFQHRVTGTDWRSKRHRARQFWGVWRALRARGVGPRIPIPPKGKVR